MGARIFFPSGEASFPKFGEARKFTYKVTFKQIKAILLIPLEYVRRTDIFKTILHFWY
jgi:hypothetical protein